MTGVGLSRPLFDDAEGVAIRIGQDNVIRSGRVTPVNTVRTQSQQPFDLSGGILGIKVLVMALVILGTRRHHCDCKLRAVAGARHQDGQSGFGSRRGS